MSTAQGSAFMLPAGDIFFFKVRTSVITSIQVAYTHQDLSILPEGPIEMAVSYKTATDGLTQALRNKHPEAGKKPSRLTGHDTKKHPQNDPSVQLTMTPWSTKRALGSGHLSKSNGTPAKPTKKTIGSADGR